MVPQRQMNGSPHHQQGLHSSPPYGSSADSGGSSPMDPKPRLRWTPELHDRFVDAVTQLGGADSKFLNYSFLYRQWRSDNPMW